MLCKEIVECTRNVPNVTMTAAFVYKERVYLALNYDMARQLSSVLASLQKNTFLTCDFNSNNVCSKNFQKHSWLVWMALKLSLQKAMGEKGDNFQYNCVHIDKPIRRGRYKSVRRHPNNCSVTNVKCGLFELLQHFFPSTATFKCLNFRSIV